MQKVVFSTDQLPADLDDRARYSLWRDRYVAEFGAADFERWPDRPFRSRSEFARLGEVGLIKSLGTLQSYARTAEHVAAESRDDVLIGVNRGGGRARLLQRGHEVVHSNGTVAVFTNAEPCRIELESENDFFGIAIPRKRLLDLVPDVRDLAPSTLPLGASPTRHVTRFINLLLTGGTDDHPRLARHAETTLVDLAALLLTTNGDSVERASKRGLRAARAEEIIREIKSRFADPALSAGLIGSKVGLSPRYVQELLQETGFSYTERVMELRLQKAREMLADRRFDHLKISELAFACGFNEPSYFNRCFRRRFGASPTEYRGTP